MDAIKHNKALKAKLEEARELATEYRQGVQNAEHMDETYIVLAIEAVTLRIGYLENQKKLKPEAAKPAEKSEEPAKPAEDEAKS
jgi:hypothetical protein